LKEHSEHKAIYKLRNNIPITREELCELEHMLFEQGAICSKENFIKVFGDQPLGKFIRSIIGLEESAATKIFSEFLSDKVFNSKQIQFIRTIISYLTVKGIVEPDMLFEPPFTDLNSNSIMGLFDDSQSKKIFMILEDIMKNADAA